MAWGTRLRQVGIVLVGAVLAAAMVVLGIWQLDVYKAQGAKEADRRATAAPVPLRDVAPAGSAITEGFGRSVTFTGQYVPNEQLLVPVDGQPGTFRVLTALRQDDGSVVPVVRGVVTSPSAPAPPAGVRSEQGVLLPSEESAPAGDGSGQIQSVRLPTLAQEWPGPLVGGFVTLSAADAADQGLTAAPLNLPEARGRLRNGAYALQWWVFAAFALGLAIRMARDLGRRDLALDEPTDQVEIEPEPGSRAT